MVFNDIRGLKMSNTFTERNTFKWWIHRPSNIKSYKCYGDTYMNHQQGQPPVLEVTFVRNRAVTNTK